MADQRQYQSWEDLGKCIEDIIDQAVTSHDYQKLNQTINKVVNNALDGVNKNIEYRKGTYNTTKYYPNKVSVKTASQETTPKLYANADKKNVGGILQVVGGSIMSFFSTMGVLSTAITGAITGSAFFSFASSILLILTAGSIYLLARGIRALGKSNRFQKYVQYLGQKTYGSIEALSKVVHKSQKFVKKELQSLIDEGYFLEGHLDSEGKNLITSNETYKHYQQSLIEQQKQKNEEMKKTLEGTPVSSEVQSVLDTGRAYIHEIRSCNDQIPGEEISGKISTMEAIVEKIFERAEAEPKTIPALKKLMDYYLPMTVKLLHAYADMDKQNLQSETINASKKEIEDTIDTLNSAFTKLLDSMFMETALDVSSDITVLNTLLAQEGLTGDDFSNVKKENTL